MKLYLLFLSLFLNCINLEELKNAEPMHYLTGVIVASVRGAQTSSSDQASFQIQGTLKDSSGNPIANAILSLGVSQSIVSREAVTTSTTTDANGNYTLNLKMGNFSVKVTNSSGVEIGSFRMNATSTTTKPEIASTSGNLNVVVNAVAPPSPIAPIVPTTPSASPPTELSYSTGTLNLTVGTPMPTLTPSIKGVVSVYSISPNLPAGLSLNPISGVLSGTPVVSISSTKYNIKASNSAGSVPFEIYLSVTLLKPSNFSYQSTSYNFVVGNLITSISPSINGTIESYSISPTLDNGLVFSSSSGIISGTPNLAQSSKEYTITASNSGGSVTFKLSIVILPIAPSNLSYPKNNLILYAGSPMQILTPSVNGDINSYSVSPDLPLGLNINEKSGVISGTPLDGKTFEVNHIITATNSVGSTSFQLIIIMKYSFIDNGNGTITQSGKNLLWQKCTIGQSINNNCTGRGTTFNYAQITDICSTINLANRSDWRLPTIDELSTLLIFENEPKINNVTFPNTESYYYWGTNPLNKRFRVNFNVGLVSGYSTSDYYYVRCISGQ